MTSDFISAIRQEAGTAMTEGASEARTAAFDAAAFYEALNAERQSRSLNWKDVAEESGVSPSTLTRLGQGKRPDVDSFARLVAWGGLDADDYVAAQRRRSEGAFMTNLPAYLRADPNLDQRGVESLEAIISAAYDQFSTKD